MSPFRTIVNMADSPNKMGISDKIMTIGSCFADTIGQKLVSIKTDVSANPFGILYGPHAIHTAIRYAIFNENPPLHTYLEHQGVVMNYDFHSAMSSLSLENLQQQLVKVIGTSHNFVNRAQWLIITYGTAWVYTRRDNGETVANCHKIPQSQFSKSLWSQEKIVDSFNSLYAELTKVNPGIRIILTVSPVRHVRDTLELNSVSKAVLRTACHAIVETHHNIAYFPAYEIMMDDLRDYRFYKSDMIHPSEVAEDYIWEKFQGQYFTRGLKDFAHRWEDIRRAMAHKPFHPDSKAHELFLQDLITKLENMKGEVNVDHEIAMVRKQLQSHDIERPK